MGGALKENERWFNLFEDKSIEEGGIGSDFLFKSEDFASFTPELLMAKYHPSLENNIDKSYISTRYKAKYNGVPIGSYNGAPFNSNSNNTATMINSYNGFNGYWGNSQTGEGTHNR